MNQILLKNPSLTPENTLSFEIIPKDSTISEGSHCFGVSYSYQVPKPEPNLESPLLLSAEQTETESLKKCKISIENKDDELKGMLICIISLQTGLKANLNDLEGLRRSEDIDFYELRKENSEVILYWRGMKAKGKREVELAFLKEFDVKNSVSTLISSYLYYDKSGSLVSELL